MKVIRSSAAIVTAYVAIAAIPLGLAVRDGEAAALALVGHLLLLGLLALATVRTGGRAFRVAADWLPLAVVPVLYAELPLLMVGAAGGEVRYFDDVILALERSLAGAPARTLAAALPSRALSELLHLCYLLYYPLIYVPPLLLYVRDSRREFHLVVTALLATFVACFATFIVFPVQGPRYFGGAPAPDGPIRALVLGILESGSSRGAAFPSSHVAVAVAQAAMAWGRGHRHALLYSAVTAGLAIGAVYGGFHYAVDVAAGALLGLATAMLLLRVLPAADMTPRSNQE